MVSRRSIRKEAGALHPRRRLDELIRYGLATMASAAISFGLPVALHEIFGLADTSAVGIGLICAFALNFVSIRLFVFRSDGVIKRQLIGFLISSGLFRLAEFWVFLLLTKLGTNYAVALIITLVCSFAAKFAVQKYIIFTRPDRGYNRPLLERR
ncbi:GtrA family protein [Rhizobium lentis]|uniref:GtrA family protein n=1 Tax=Rhizobium lentis TaxID=1138194 RepID=UPI001C83FC11|nr:GtrA family protein [Rhizobium lentis]MBX5056653.1 GtrA family protein [Rhizobium lentis]MBX5074653.1 GtrA family protein [Rhizobium lentis]MBX5111659.1 GtrA family protein [Rhizobium lentis]MBX5117979.1 GtrA family protein [Rhizobium lentis]